MAGYNDVPFSMEEIFDFMGVDYWKYARNRTRFNMPCPHCDRSSFSKTRLNVNLEKKVWRCAKCGAGGNGVNYYKYVTTGDHTMSATEYGKTIEFLKTAMGNSSEYAARRQTASAFLKKEKQITKADMAPDKILHQTFSALLKLPVFALRDEHRQNLLSRGLDDDAIQRNGYRSFPSGVQMDPFIDPMIRVLYKRNNWGEVRLKIPKLNKIGDIALQIGLSIGSWLQQAECIMEGVPGFFLFEGHWCFLIPEKGIIIPTRNMRGQIVALQVRTNNKNVRYLTISASGLENGVTENISRVHWPLDNDSLQGGPDLIRPEILITEGPLKADVALHLLRKGNSQTKIAFVAIQGINNTNALMRDCDRLVKLGYKSVTNALDMDRLTNINVLNGTKRLRQLLEEKDLKFKSMYWDPESAAHVAQELFILCERTEGVKMPEKKSQNPFVAAAQFTVALADAGVAVPDGIADWPSSTKGIDDHLKTVMGV